MRSYTLVLLAAFTGISAGTPAFADGGTTSDELPPVVCNPGRFIAKVTCTGGYCDNVSIVCQDMRNARIGNTFWTDFFSEEHGGFQGCPIGEGYFIAELACNHDYCDNVSLFCAQVTNLVPNSVVNCQNGNRFSEEGPTNFSEFLGKFSYAAQCFGGYCDDMQFTFCDAVAQP